MSTTLGRSSASQHDLDRKEEKLAMGARGIVVPPGQAPVSPGRSFALKLRGGETGDSIMMFEETIPAGTKSTFHLHHDSDEVAYVLSGEVTFKIGDEVTVGGPGTCAFMPRDVPHAWKSTGAETGKVLFLYTPAKAGGLIEEQQRTGRGFRSMNERELAEILQRHGWELLGPSPL
jgi:quercetin dioxygenase-like cupin family protein